MPQWYPPALRQFLVWPTLARACIANNREEKKKEVEDYKKLHQLQLKEWEMVNGGMLPHLLWIC